MRNKKIICLGIVFSILLFIFLILCFSDVSYSNINNDLKMSSLYFDIYMNKYEEIELIEKLNNGKVDNTFKDFILSEYEKVKNNEIEIEVEEVLKDKYAKTMGDSKNSPIDTSNLTPEQISERLNIYVDGVEVDESALNILDLDDKEVIKIKDLSGKNALRKDGVLIEIVDIFNILCYNNIENNSIYHYKYYSYELDGKKVYVKYKNMYDNSYKVIIFNHNIFGNIKEVTIQ